jgi:hypothetical protein
MANDIGRSLHRDRFPATSAAHSSAGPGTARVMNPRRGIALLAALAILMHAGLLVRHHALMLEIAREHHSLIADLTSLCRAGPGMDRAAPADLPPVPRPADADSCPVCAGLVAAFAVLDTQAAAARIAHETATAADIVDGGAPSTPIAAHPPARGPPAPV